MPAPLMPKATAVWLVENTTLNFDQIAAFCGLHPLEIQAIADGEVAIGMIGMSPVVSGQLTAEEIKRCEGDPRAKLKMLRSDLPQPVARSKGPRYTPVTKRADKPDGVSYLLKTHPELQDAQIARLIGTTKDTIAKIRDRSHWNTNNIKPRDPVLLGLCKRTDLDAALRKAQRRLAREAKAAEKAAREAGVTPENLADAPTDQQEVNSPFQAIDENQPEEPAGETEQINETVEEQPELPAEEDPFRTSNTGTDN